MTYIIMESPQTHGLSTLTISTKEVAIHDRGDPNAMVLLHRAGTGLTCLDYSSFSYLNESLIFVR